MPLDQPVTHRALPVQTREATFQPSTVNVEKRTVELVWSTGADVRRYDWWNNRYYIERLSMKDGAVNLDRLNGGAPLLNSHQRFDLSSIIGVVERAWIESGEGRAVVRFSERDNVASILKDVQDGIIRNVSIGYEVRKYEVTERKGEDALYEAVDWTPSEISLVPIPADPDAGVRSAPDGKEKTCVCEFINRAAAQNEGVEAMPEKNTGGAPAETKEQTAVANDTRALETATQEAAKQAREAERTRQSDIRTAARALNIGDEHIQQFIDDDVSADVARQRMIDIVAEQNRANRVGSPAVQTDRPSGDDPAVKRGAMAEALFVRGMSGRHGVKPSDHAREFMHMNFSDIAGEVLTDAGVRGVSRMSKSQVINMVLDRASPGHTTSDFANIVLDAQNKILLKEYQVAEPTYRRIAARHNFADFKTHHLIRLGDFPDLLPVGEDGEIKSGTMKDSKETATLATYGRKIKLSRRLLINDDMGAFAVLPAKVSQKAIGLENRTVIGIATGNPTMADGVALYHASHGNLAGTASTIDVANMALAVAGMRKQRGRTDDKRTTGEALNLVPRYCLCGPDRELVLRQLLAVVTATKASDYNPYSGMLEPLVDATITDNAWFLFAEPSLAEAIIYGFLDGAEGPQLTATDVDIDGLVMKVVHDFAAAAVDFKPTYKNAGA